jgi:hypothetical protein
LLARKDVHIYRDALINQTKAGSQACGDQVSKTITGKEK